jgi:DNA-binding transcriptional ArsR family regulator
MPSLLVRVLPWPDVQQVCRISPGGILNKVVEESVLDRTYAALADPTRRALLVALQAGEARITDLAAPFEMTFAGVSRQLKVLEAAGLVRREIRGREHWLTLRVDPLTAAERWIGEQTRFWSTRADALAARLRRRARGT